MGFRKYIPALIGRATYLVGLIDILANVLHPFKASATKIQSYLPIFTHSTAFATAVFTGVVLIIVARGLIRRKKRAWAIAVGIILINLASNLFRNRTHLLQISVVAALLIALLLFRKEFYAVSDPSTKLQPIRAFVLSFIIVVVIGLFLIYFRHDHQVVGNPSFGLILLAILKGLIGVTGTLHFKGEGVGDTFDTTMLSLGVLTLILPLWLFFRRVKPIPKMSDEELQLVKKLIKHDQEQDSLGYFATRRDKSVIWSNNKKAGIAYRVEGGVMLASGDPFGEYSLWPEAIANFLEVAREHAWTPAVMGAGDRGGEVWVEHAGMQALEIGDEAIINVPEFTLEGRPMANVRQMVNRIKRKGYSCYTSKFVELPIEDQRELVRLAKEWRYGVPERGFSMGLDRFGESVDEDCIITIAEIDGVKTGFLHFVPWDADSISLDRMQRERGSDPGVTELMIVSTAEWAQENKIKYISLNFAAFRSLFERADKISAGFMTRTLRNIIRFFSNWFPVESLYRFNAKFQPEWRTRYVLYPGAKDLPKVGIAAIRAEKFIQSFRSHSA
jgi:lysyl-tRNA synthetase class 2